MSDVPRERNAATDTDATALETLARAAGLLVEWEDAAGAPHHLEAGAQRTLLERLGLPAGDDTACGESLRQLQAEARALPPMVTAIVDTPVALPALPPGQRYEIHFETGGSQRGTVGADGVLPPIPETGYHRLSCGERHCTIAVAPPRCYSVDDAGRDGQDAQFDRLDAAARSLDRRAWGIAVQVYGLRGSGRAHALGVGDYTALARFAERAAQAGAAALAISPLHAMFGAAPEKFSPYAPSSRLLLNTLHIDPGAVLGEDWLDDAIVETGLAARFNELDRAELVDWVGVASARDTLLRALFARWQASPDHPSRENFARFCEEGGETLRDHARFEAIARHHDGHWRDWPEGLRGPRAPQVASFAATHRDEVDYHLFLQWLADQGLADAQRRARDNGMPIGLIADLAVGTDGAGSHSWSFPAAMLDGLSVGAPPDLFNKAGQSWGLTTFAPRALVAQGFAPFIAMLRAAMRHAGGIRIDHILGLRRLWLVPEGAAASGGGYLLYPLVDLLRLTALESVRHRAIVVGEDLGTVPPGLRDALVDAGLLGMRVLWFERGRNKADDDDAERGARSSGAAGGATGHGENAAVDTTSDAPDDDAVAPFLPPSEWDRDALAMTSTHDLPTLAGWWQGHDIAWRERAGQIDASARAQEETQRCEDRAALRDALLDAGFLSDAQSAGPDAVVDAALAFVASTPAPLAIFPLEDLLGLPDQPNLPGPDTGHPNWRRRSSADTALGLDADATRRRIALINRARTR